MKPKNEGLEYQRPNVTTETKGLSVQSNTNWLLIS